MMRLLGRASGVRSNRLVGALLPAAWACAPLLACSEQGTEIVFVIESDLAVPGAANRVEIKVVAQSDQSGVEDYTSDETLTIGPSADDDVAGFPVRYSVRAGSRYHTRVWLTATAFRDGLRVVATSAGTDFVSGRSVTQTLGLPAGVTCQATEIVCGGVCVDTRSSGENCNWCGNECGGGEPCVNGSCQCPGGRERCESGCVDLDRDPLNCGACANRCATGEVCWERACQAECPAGVTDCGGWCIDTTRDPANCGGCGTACNEGQGCVAGSCGSSCAPMLPGGQCSVLEQCPCPEGEGCDLARPVGGGPEWDPAMGSGYTGPEICTAAFGGAGEGEPCPTLAECAAGLACIPNAYGDGTPICMIWCVLGDGSNCGEDRFCVRLSGQGIYGVCRRGLHDDDICNGMDDNGDGAIDELVDFLNDPRNCFFCGNDCGDGGACVGGACQSGCPGGSPVCSDGGCASEWDRANCGRCDNMCPSFWVCTRGACVPDCGGDTAVTQPCEGDAAGGFCAAVWVDPRHCGGCGISCVDGEACIDGVCAGSCPAEATLCRDRFCRNTAEDPAACGGCGVRCPSGHRCEGAACQPCSPTPPLGGACVLTSGCGCSPHEHCVLTPSTGSWLEYCVPRRGDLREGESCHPPAEDCGAGLACMAMPGGREEAYCVRACIIGADSETDCGAAGGCVGMGFGAPVDYGICLYGAAGGVGSACETAAECSSLAPARRACLHDIPGTIPPTPLPSGYCTERACAVGPGSITPCPIGSTCEEFGDGGRYCLRSCDSPIRCRFWEDYSCTWVGSSRHCWLAGGTVTPPTG